SRAAEGRFRRENPQPWRRPFQPALGQGSRRESSAAAARIASAREIAKPVPREGFARRPAPEPVASNQNTTITAGRIPSGPTVSSDNVEHAQQFLYSNPAVRVRLRRLPFQPEGSILTEKVLRRAFRAAAVYNVCWGTATAVHPGLFFDIFGLPP